MTNFFKKLFGLLLLFVATIANGQTLLDSKFEGINEFEKYIVIDQNEDGQTWTYDDIFLAASCARDFDADDWLITPPLSLTAGKTYRLTFIANADYEDAEKLTVALGKSATIVGLNTMLIDDLELTSTNQQEYSATFKATETNNFYIGFRLLTTGSFFSNRVYLHSIKVEEGTDQGVPAAVSNLTITPATGGQLKATVAFKSPTQSIGGTTLSSITKIDVYRNNSIVKTFNTPTPGQQLSYEDIVGASGKYTYRIVATNELGEGEGVEQEAFIGMDEPGNVTNVRFVYNYETKTSTITWDAPTVGKNGGYIDTSGITYNIRRFHAKEPVATGLTATTFEDVVDIDFLLEEEERMRQEYADIGMPVNITYVIDDEGLMQYYVQAVLTTGTSGEAVSNSVIIGEPNNLPYYESFPDGKLSHYWRTDIRDKRARWGAMTSTLFCQDGDGGMMGFGAIESEETAMCHTGNIDMTNAVSPMLTFYYFPEYPMENPLLIKVSLDGSEFQTIASIPLNEDATSNRYNRISVPLTGCAGVGHVKIGFESTTATTVDNLFIDNIRIIDQRQNDLQISLGNLPKYLKVGEKRNIPVVVENLGTNDVATGKYNIDVYVNNVKAASTQGLSVASEETKSYMIQLAGSIDMEKESEIYAEVVYEQDEMVENNRTEVQAIGVKMPLYPEATNLSIADDNGIAVLSWQQPASPKTEDGYVTDSFEDYTDFERFNYGDWTLFDGDFALTYAIGGWNFPKNSDVQSWMIWNPSEVVNSTTGNKGLIDQLWYPRTGNKMVASFGAYQTNSDDWLISPELSGHEQVISFYGHSMPKASAPDQFTVCISSTTNDPSAFEAIDQTPVTATSDWKQYEYALPEGTKYFAIHKTTYDGWVLFVDDITFAPDTLAATPDIMLYGFNVYKNGTRLNTALVSTPTFTDNNAQAGDTYRVTAVYDAGESVYSNMVIYRGDEAAIVERVDDSINNTDETTYDLQGRKLKGMPQRGIVISKNRKVVVK